MRAPLRAAVTALVLPLGAVPAVGEDERLFAGDFVDREELPGVRHQILSDQPVDDGDDHLMQVRTTLQPGAHIPPSVFSDHWASSVESGSLAVVGKSGRLARGKQGPRRVVETGQTLYSSTDDVLSWANRGMVPVEVLSVVLFDNDHDPIARAESVPLFEDLFEGEVVDRIVRKGIRQNGQRFRLVVRDRSGMVLGARLATPVESAWARPAWDLDSDVGFADGHGARGTELLVGFMSYPCGPDVVIDVGEGLKAVRVIDRYDGGCDSSAERHDVILRIREPEVWDPEEILAQKVGP